MVRTIKATTAHTLKKEERAVLLPGPTGAESWEVWILSPSGHAECAQTCATPQDNRLRKGATLALPVSQVFCLPLWLNETDAKQFAGIIPLQLELRGLQTRGNHPPIFDWTVVAREGTRTLVMVGMLPASLPPEFQAADYAAFDLSARYLPFPENTLTLWQEQDRLAFAITRGPHLVYYQALTEGRITPRVLQDLNCACATLTMQGILTPLQQAVLWMEVSPGELTVLQSALQLPVRQAERPQPVAPSPAWKLVPPAVHEAKRTREIQGWWKKGGLIALAAYLLVVAWMLTHLFLTSRRVNELRQWQSDHAQALALIHETRAAWKDLRPVVDENSYPLELLLHVADAIPADQLHLTLFETSNGHLLIKGEAQNASFAFQFFNKLKSDPHFAVYNPVMGNPHPLPNDLTQFQIEGTRATQN